MKRWNRLISFLLAAGLALACSKQSIIPEPQPVKEPGENPSAPEKPVEEPPAQEQKLSGTSLRGSRWTGLDLGAKYRITKVGCSTEGRVQLALFEGANEADFSDALPLVMIKETAPSGTMLYLSVNCSSGFRYVRYVRPADTGSLPAEVEFHGLKEEGDLSQLYQLTNLPTVVINTQKEQAITSKKDYVNARVYLISEGGTKLLSTIDTGVRGRGNASWGFPKKPYKLHFATKQSVLGSPSTDRKWTLINNYGDKTLMRNILAFEVSRRVGMAYTPFCTPVDLILNGEYQGCYQLCDQVEVGTGRVPAKDGYLIEIDAYAYDEPVHFYSAKGIPVTVKYPQDDVITQEQLNFIKSFFAKTETAALSASFQSSTLGYRKYLDLDSFLRNFIVGEFSGNTDTYWSVNLYKDAANGVFFTGPAWDYDLAFENDNRTYPINHLSDFIYAGAGSVASDAVRTIVNNIIKKDPDARARLVELWDEYKPALESLNDYVDQTAALLDESEQLNFIRWPILNKPVHQNPKAYGTYAAEVKVVKDYITARLDRFDQLVRQ